MISYFHVLVRGDDTLRSASPVPDACGRWATGTYGVRCGLCKDSPKSMSRLIVLSGVTDSLNMCMGSALELITERAQRFFGVFAYYTLS